MSNIKIKLHLILISLLIIPVFTACQNSQNSSTLDVTWKVAVDKFEIKEKLYTIEAVVQYDGSTIDEVHEQDPATGYVYLILNATITKINPESTVPFDWKKIGIEDSSGNLYPRMENDTFVEQYQYTPRITGLELRFGEYQGWMCFEIPATSSEGKINLVYTGDDSQQSVPLK